MFYAKSDWRVPGSTRDQAFLRRKADRLWIFWITPEGHSMRLSLYIRFIVHFSQHSFEIASGAWLLHCLTPPSLSHAAALFQTASPPVHNWWARAASRSNQHSRCATESQTHIYTYTEAEIPARARDQFGPAPIHSAIMQAYVVVGMGNKDYCVNRSINFLFH